MSQCDGEPRSDDRRPGTGGQAKRITHNWATMSENKGAYGTTAADTNFRRKWDKEEYAEKARQKDSDEKERMQENEREAEKGKGRR